MVSVVVLTIALLAEEVYREQTFVVEMYEAMLHVESAEHSPIHSAKFVFGVELICDVLVLLTACALVCL
jgi:hypothetical protein